MLHAAKWRCVNTVEIMGFFKSAAQTASAVWFVTASYMGLGQGSEHLFFISSQAASTCTDQAEGSTLTGLSKLTPTPCGDEPSMGPYLSGASLFCYTNYSSSTTPLSSWFMLHRDLIGNCNWLKRSGPGPLWSKFFGNSEEEEPYQAEIWTSQHSLIYTIFQLQYWITNSCSGWVQQ